MTNSVSRQEAVQENAPGYVTIMVSNICSNKCKIKNCTSQKCISLFVVLGNIYRTGSLSSGTSELANSEWCSDSFGDWAKVSLL